MHRRAILVLVCCLLTSGCTSTGALGLVTAREDASTVLTQGPLTYDELGAVEGEACRHFVLAIIPWGASDFRAAVDDALSKKGGDALINVTVDSSLYGIFPIYNVYSITCTRVRGTAVRLR